MFGRGLTCRDARFKISAKGRGIRDPPRSRRNKKKNVCFILPSLSAKVRRAKYCHVKCRLVASIVHPSRVHVQAPEPRAV